MARSTEINQSAKVPKSINGEQHRSLALIQGVAHDLAVLAICIHTQVDRRQALLLSRVARLPDPNVGLSSKPTLCISIPFQLALEDHFESLDESKRSLCAAIKDAVGPVAS